MPKLLISAVLLSVVFSVNAQEARLLRFPAVYGNQVVFSYAGDLFTVDKSGGVARRLTSHQGYEMFPHFSHDGKWIAFNAQYDGNTEVYIMPSQGGEPKRITYTATLSRDDVSDRMGPNNIPLCWSPDDKSVIFRSRQYSFNSFKGQLFKAPISGDISTELPFSVAGWCTYNADGTKLAYNRVFREFRTWKYYRGGQADDIWIYDTKTDQTENVTNNPAQDIFPMYYQDKVYFFSDRDRTMNLFEYNTSTKQTRKLTSFTDYDCKFPSLGNDAIAFENGGYIYLYDLSAQKVQKVPITIAEDFSVGRSKQIDATKFIGNLNLSPDGNRIVLSARGDIFTLPATKGVTRNLTNSPGVHERDVEWSPDGHFVSYISDKTGEDEVFIQKQDGSEPAKQITKGGGSYKYYPTWSPDGKFLLLSNREQDLFYINVATGEKIIVYHSESSEVNNYGWSPDSKWIVYDHPGIRAEFTTIHLYNIETKKNIPLTDSWYQSYSGVFSSDGKYLSFISARDFNPLYSNTEWNHAYVDMEKIYVIQLSKDSKSFFETKNDEVSLKDDTAKSNPAKKKTDKKDDADIKTPLVKIDEDGILDRIEALPIPSGNYSNLVPQANGVYYAFSAVNKPPVVKYFDFKKQSENPVGSFTSFNVSTDGKKVLIGSGGDYYLQDLSANKIETTDKVNTGGVKLIVDYKAEWKQIFDESWRQMRDFFYDPNMHGLNWKAIHDKYAVLVPYVNHRNDLTYLIGEMIGELSIGHAYVNSGDRVAVEKIPLGLLGAKLSRDQTGYYRIDKILNGESWNSGSYSPFQAPGVNVKQGEFIISINGRSVKEMTNLFESLIGKANQTVELMVNTIADSKGARKIFIRPLSDESTLYYNEWVTGNIAKVTKASNGKIGYLHIPDMGPEGLSQFARYFYPQLDKKALIIDDRGNGGGNVSPMIIERLRREPGLGTMMRNNKYAGIKPAEEQVGPKVCLIDQFSASDGDLFPYQFSFYKIGPLIGQRTWGGVIGIRGSLPFIDGGTMTRPEFGHFVVDGSKWGIEGTGVSPDIEVINDPHEDYKGNDVQLTRAIDELLKQLKEKGEKNRPAIPPFPDKSK